MKLTNRLNAVVSLVSQRKVADIGCDHGKTAIKLILDKISDFVIASDVNKGPAEACRKNVAKYGLTEQIEVRCGNGISVLKPEEADCIIIAGMGGELISKIIDDNIEVAKLAKEIIMQPMTSEESLREYLTENGFCITDEVLAKEGEKIYVIIKAVTGKGTDKYYFPELLGRNDRELINAYYNKVTKRINDKIKGAEIGNNTEESTRYKEILNEVNKIYESISNN